MSRSQVDVAIIGGGAAGVAAARRLVEAGRDALLIEAGSRLGGRGFTRIDPLGGALDLGCGWLHSGDRNPWTGIAERSGVAVDRTPAPWSRPGLGLGFSEADAASFGAARDDFHAAMESLLASRDDASVAKALAPGRWSAMLAAINSYVTGGEVERVSARDLANYADSGVNWRLPGGYGALIAGHGAGLPVALHCPATRVDHSGARMRIETPKGAIEAKSVIVTVSSALIADGAIAFTPELADKREAAAGLPLGLADKLYFAIERPDDLEPDSRAFGRGDSRATGAYHIRPLGRPVVECYFGGDCAAALERGGEAAFADFARAELAGPFGADFPKRLTALPMHLWAADPLARGSYSYAAPGRAGDRARLAAPVDGRLFFAGEACSAEDYSTAHGAYRTGLAAAEAVLASN